jgi:hypothetical protein
VRPGWCDLADQLTPRQLAWLAESIRRPSRSPRVHADGALAIARV